MPVYTKIFSVISIVTL